MSAPEDMEGDAYDAEPGSKVEWLLPSVPEMVCPKCGAELPDFDGFGVLAHTKPAYPDGCGFCSHPSRDNGVCGICGDVRAE